MKDAAAGKNAAQVRRYELHLLMGAAVLVFLGCFYLFNLKAFF